MTRPPAPRRPDERERVLTLLRAHAPALRARGVRSLALFGSVARNEAHPDSDVDLLLDLDARAGLGFGVVSLKGSWTGSSAGRWAWPSPAGSVPPSARASSGTSCKSSDMVDRQRDCLLQISDEIAAARRLAAGHTFDSFVRDEITVAALERSSSASRRPRGASIPGSRISSGQFLGPTSPVSATSCGTTTTTST
jgi:hypothetical protein